MSKGRAEGEGDGRRSKPMPVPWSFADVAQLRERRAVTSAESYSIGMVAGAARIVNVTALLMCSGSLYTVT